MASAKTPQPAHSLPEGFSAVPIHDPGAAPVRLCVVVQRSSDALTGPLVLLRDWQDARVYLACLTDTAGRVREWLELWVQNVDALQGSLAALRETLSNSSLDVRWTQQAAAFRELNPGCFVETGWESTHPRPIFIAAANRTILHAGATDPDGPWELCRDDSALQSAGLPAYTTSLFRYLYQPAASAHRRFVATTADAPQSDALRPLSEIFDGAALVPVNPQGGLMLATSLYPIRYDDYADLLGGKPWKGVELGKAFFPFGGVYRTLGDWHEIQQSGAHLFLARQGAVGRLVETFHLKLQLLAEAVALVHSFVARQQLPFLNLGADSFSVKLEPAGAKLPFFWTSRCALVKPSQAIALPVEASEFHYFVRARAVGPSVYLPENLGRPQQGSASVRIRQVLPGEQGRTVVEGTLVMEESFPVSPRDLVWIRFPLPSGRVELYGHLYTEEGLAHGEARFRTLAQRLPEAAAKALAAVEGVTLPRSSFEIVPLLSSPCDLYSLGVLAVRTLLVDDKTTLPVAVDEILSLARQVAAEHDPDVPLGQRLGAIFKKEKRYAESLGPHHLLRDSIEPEQAVQLLPTELWFDTLGTILRFLPGAGPDSFCRDFGDAPALSLETAFNQALESLEKLLLRSRSLIVTDWRQNHEIHSVIQNWLARQNPPTHP